VNTLFESSLKSFFATFRIIYFRVADSDAQAEFISAEHKTVSFERLREERTVFSQNQLDGCRAQRDNHRTLCAGGIHFRRAQNSEFRTLRVRNELFFPKTNSMVVERSETTIETYQGGHYAHDIIR